MGREGHSQGAANNDGASSTSKGAGLCNSRKGNGVIHDDGDHTRNKPRKEDRDPKARLCSLKQCPANKNKSWILEGRKDDAGTPKDCGQAATWDRLEQDDDAAVRYQQISAQKML